MAVLIPFRGEISQLSEAVKSVRKSHFKDFRILVFDDNDQTYGRPDFLQDDEYFPTGGIGLAAVKPICTVQFIKRLLVLFPQINPTLKPLE